MDALFTELVTRLDARSTDSKAGATHVVVVPSLLAPSTEYMIRGHHGRIVAVDDTSPTAVIYFSESE